ncbi:alpha/beta fold hydrolase [Trinickia caryophylli]|uniref:Proline iminopeptidase n=1 Tax=Trinickia caryophylli TaxID=28094 RepID=A0A1X7CGT6_TRICW|nr:alpha/beta fold hydrolase [Trinickia caryophylli]PMS11578.1 prolyl aminopeptidase [Trinickia caryophylli]TRX19869.1 alpha/beta fold hydrolase [Trinickia caryophylli]WQE12797.1 alpha/beta fold hydrolase [Trinickia caryophylli]SME96397.1 prolyl aminopeptidase Serine peptidase. MEROPS family S33 [Trinickia caryophylli]GLU30513.1 proline iminopeptidase [Trinickia caryophylli]
MSHWSSIRHPRTSGTPERRYERRYFTRDGQRIAFTLAGAASGTPVVVLHGGPGSGSQIGTLRLFDLARFRVVLVDQRGAGASSPRGIVRQNRTDRLIGDMEAIRRHLGIERWGVVGGSWGAALALAYAGTHPSRVSGVVLRGLFLASRQEVRQLFIRSRSRAPRAWRALWRAAGGGRASVLARRCADSLAAGAPAARQRAVAVAWREYERAVLASAHRRRVRAHPRVSNRDATALVAKYRVQAHYLSHDCWLGPRRLLRLAQRAASHGVRIAAIHGSRDPVCPPANLDRLARAVPATRAERVARAGHLGSEPALADALRRAVEAMFG